MWRRNSCLKDLYESLNIKEEDDPMEVITKIMLWVKMHFKVRAHAQIKINDPFIELEEIIRGRKQLGHVNNCKEVVALLAILLICMPIKRRPNVYIQFCSLREGRDHVRICVELDDKRVPIPLDLEYFPPVEVYASYQIGGKK
jgi:hypothetical protein